MPVKTMVVATIIGIVILVASDSTLVRILTITGFFALLLMLSNEFNTQG